MLHNLEIEDYVAFFFIMAKDMAKEMMNYTKQNILLQAAQGMLARANQQPQGVLQLLN